MAVPIRPTTELPTVVSAGGRVVLRVDRANAIGDSPYTVADNDDVWFTVTSGGVTRQLLLDKLPVPAGIPPEVPLV
jgi:hypothetical protein